MKDFWNQRYSETQYAYGTEANTFLRQSLEHLNPGKLFLPGEGEGRNAVHAALRGWEVHGVDFSEAGRQKALALAAEQDVTIHYDVADLAEYIPPAEHFDAAALIFVHLPVPLRHAVHASVMRSLKSGGMLILEAFSIEQLERDTGGPRTPEMLYDLDDLLADFTGMEIIHRYAGTAPVHEGPYHTGDAEVIRLLMRRH
jgi:SAM-dependent methyltransferase